VSESTGRRRWWHRRTPEVVDLRSTPSVDVRGSELAALTRMRDSGLLTASEYESERRRIEESRRQGDVRP
jgi:hypothetical protein